MKRVVFTIGLFILSFCATSAARAAEIYLDPASGKYPPGVTFGVDVRLDNQGQCINAAEVDLAYPKATLIPIEASEGDSIFSLWIKEPTIYKDYGMISFAGGLPGGYCGRVSGDPSLSNKLATVYFQFATSTVASGVSTTAQLSFLPTTQATVNDGLGTAAKLTTAGAVYAEITQGEYAPENAWQNALQEDTTPPEPFPVNVYKDPQIFNGAPFAVFSTVDKQTGIDHYEVAEVSATDANLPDTQLNWVRAVSPYLVKNPTTDALLKVRAIDMEGNARVESYNFQTAAPSKNWELEILPYLAIAGLIGFGLIKLIMRFLL